MATLVAEPTVEAAYMPQDEDEQDDALRTEILRHGFGADSLMLRPAEIAEAGTQLLEALSRYICDQRLNKRWRNIVSDLSETYRQDPEAAVVGTMRIARCLMAWGMHKDKHAVLGAMLAMLRHSGAPSTLVKGGCKQGHTADPVIDGRAAAEVEAFLHDYVWGQRVGPEMNLKPLAMILKALGNLPSFLPSAASTDARQWAEELIAGIPQLSADMVVSTVLAIWPDVFELQRGLLDKLLTQKCWDEARRLVETVKVPADVKRTMEVDIVAALRAEPTQFKRAYLTCKAWELQSVYSDYFVRFKTADIQDKVRKGKWGIAEAMLPNKSTAELAHYRRVLVEALIESHHFATASKLITQYGITDMQVDPGLVEAEMSQRVQSYLTFQLPATSLRLIDSLEGLTTAREFLLGGHDPGVEGQPRTPQVLGLDVEWSATFWGGSRASSAASAGGSPGVDPEMNGDVSVLESSRGSEDDSGLNAGGAVAATPEEFQLSSAAASAAAVVPSGKAALLQMSSHRTVVLFDLLAIGPSPDLSSAFDTYMGPLLADACWVKCGFQVVNDVKQLRKSWPNILSLHMVESLLDLAEVNARIKPRVKLNGQAFSHLSEYWLGKKLDKTEQTSNWERRPLQPDQLEYAALDAHACVQIFDKLLAWQRTTNTAVIDRWTACVKKSADAGSDSANGGAGGSGNGRRRYRR